MDTETLILNNNQVQQKITRIAHEIHEQNFKEKELVFVNKVDNSEISLGVNFYNEN